MGYPDSIDRFTDKLNRKVGGASHVIEERLELVKGAYSGPLAHDNINNQSISVYTGPGYSGVELRNFTVGFPDDLPWRREIRIYAEVPEVYVTYETTGDTIEADDINRLQRGLTAVQGELEWYKLDGRIDGGTFKEEV
ncbi:phosphoglucomutase [Paenibacillus donghaensis]|uniref:Phosphoglucomutase n=1 Tax=Paenibacillus donghaensis TaxID=414771 RepID=A0A2Z2KTU5_9BACL|nr:phosphoglucomutase [Paenibacillus donghaensis]ASA24311.1 phosphoglucomutase [Paenibacillus donghaensis]